MKFDRASILLLSPDGRSLRFRELEPKERKFLGRASEIPVEGSAAGQAIQDGKPIYTPDLKHDPAAIEIYNLPFSFMVALVVNVLVSLATRAPGHERD